MIFLVHENTKNIRFLNNLQSTGFYSLKILFTIFINSSLNAISSDFADSNSSTLTIKDKVLGSSILRSAIDSSTFEGVDLILMEE